MKALAIVLVALLGAGCVSQFAGSGIRADFNCEDYANAWARQAQKQGHEDSGVLRHRSEKSNDGHAICWIRDGEEIVFIEPQAVPPRRIELSEYERTHILGWSVGPSLGDGKCGTLFYKSCSDIGK